MKTTPVTQVFLSVVTSATLPWGVSTLVEKLKPSVKKVLPMLMKFGRLGSSFVWVLRRSHDVDTFLT